MSATFTPIRRNAAIALFATLAVILTSACGAEAGQEDAPATATPGAEDEAPAEERFSPLIINSISPDPIPVTGTDQREHLVYELKVQNASPRPATVTKVETMDGDDVIATLEGPQITALSMIVGDFALPPIPADVIPPGRSVLMIMQAVFDEGASVPSASSTGSPRRSASSSRTRATSH